MRQRTKEKPALSYYDNTDKSCRWCGGQLSGRRTRFCKSECQTEFWSRRNWGMLKTYVHKRDDWTCQMCRIRRVGDFGKNHADHIVPVSDGGDEFDPGNVRTLCVDCHKIVTKAWHAERARAKRVSKEI